MYNLKINSKGKLVEPPKLTGLFRVKEKIGIAIINPRGVLRGKKSTIVGG